MSERLYHMTIYYGASSGGEKYTGPLGPVRVLAPHRRTLFSRSGRLRRVDLPWVVMGEVCQFGAAREQLFVGFEEDPRDGEMHEVSLHVWHGGKFVGHVCLGKSVGCDVWSTAWSDEALGVTVSGEVSRYHSLFVPTEWQAALRATP